MKKRKIKKRINILLLVIFIAAAVYLYVHIYMIPDISGALTSTQIVSYGQIETSNEARCMIVREETVTYADRAGTLSYYAGEGEKTRINSKILDIYPAGQTACPYYCQLTGFISYAIDGLEEQYNPENAASVSPLLIMQGEDKVSDVTKKTCEKNDPLFKTITSDEWCILIAADLSNAGKYTAGEKITVSIYKDGSSQPPAGEASGDKSTLFTHDKQETGEEESEALIIADIPASVTGVYEKDGMLLVAAQTKRYFKELASIRFADVKVVTSRKEGLLLSSSAVVSEDGVTGVYKKEISGEYKFVPVQVIASDEENCIVTPDSFTRDNPDGTKTSIESIRIYDEILKNGADGAAK